MFTVEDIFLAETLHLTESIENLFKMFSRYKGCEIPSKPMEWKSKCLVKLKQD